MNKSQGSLYALENIKGTWVRRALLYQVPLKLASQGPLRGPSGWTTGLGKKAGTDCEHFPVESCTQTVKEVWGTTIESTQYSVIRFLAK